MKAYIYAPLTSVESLSCKTRKLPCFLTVSSSVYQSMQEKPCEIHTGFCFKMTQAEKRSFCKPQVGINVQGYGKWELKDKNRGGVPASY